MGHRRSHGFCEVIVEAMTALNLPETGLIIIQRLHRLVRHGYRPWVGYDVASLQDRNISLHRKRSVATILPDGTVTLTARVGANGHTEKQTSAIAADDHRNFDALFPPNAPNKRNLMRRLYEIGL
jgi:hypothetical protein